MAQITNTHSSYDASGASGVGLGNREDLSDMIFDVSPTETPVLTAIKKTKAKATNHEWLTHSLTAAATNANIEGDDTSFDAATTETRLGNYTQILKKSCIVAGTQESVDKAGTKSEMAKQMARRMKEIKRDMEYAITDGGAAIGNAKVAGNDTTAREMGSLNSYLVNNVSVGSTGAASAGNGAVMTAGTDRAFSEALLTTVLETTFSYGGNPNLLVVSPTNKGVISQFTGTGPTRYVTTDDKKLTASIDVYEGDFHTLKIVADNFMVGDNVYAIDPEYLALAELRPLFAEDLAKTGDAIKKQLIWEATLEVCNPDAHALVADTNG